MDFEIEETIPVSGDLVEVRARLADGRVAILTLPKGSDYSAGVSAYLAKAQADAEAQAAAASEEGPVA